MTPTEMQNRIEALEAFVKSLQSSSTIPFSIDAAFADRFSLGGVPSSKTAASETQAVNEAGSATYSVSKPMDGFIVVGGKNVGYWN